MTQAIDDLLAKGAKAVVISSVEFKQSPNDLMLFGKSAKGESVCDSITVSLNFYFLHSGEVVKLVFPKFEAAFVGTGDLFAALLLGWSHEGLKVLPLYQK